MGFIVFDHVSKVYPDGTRAVDDLCLEVDRGELVCLIGPSGCGKTTTLEMVNRLVEPSAGRVWIDGRDTAEVDPIALRRSVGYVIQQIGLFPHLTVEQNIALPLRLRGWSRERMRARVRELLELVGLDPDVYAARYPRELSGGQQQRIGVLRALAAEPEIVLMDEPFGALDPIARDQLQEELKRLQARLRKTILFVTHDLDEALRLADRIVVMRAGRVVQVGTPEEILRAPADDFVRAFVGADRLLRNPYEVRVRDVMLARPVTLGAERGAAEALERMRARRVDTLVVVDGEGRYLGVLPFEAAQEAVARGRRVRAADLAQPVPPIDADAHLVGAGRRMAQQRLRLLPVVDDAGRLVGLLTRASFVDAVVFDLWGAEAEPAAGDAPPAGAASGGR